MATAVAVERLGVPDNCLFGILSATVLMDSQVKKIDLMYSSVMVIIIMMIIIIIIISFLPTYNKCPLIATPTYYMQLNFSMVNAYSPQSHIPYTVWGLSHYCHYC